MKKRSKFFWIVARIVNHTHEQSPTEFLNLHGNRNSKNYELLFNYSETKRKENCRTVSCNFLVHSNFLLSAALQQVFPLVVVAHCHPFWLKAVYLPFSRKIEHYIHLHVQQNVRIQPDAHAFLAKSCSFFTRHLHNPCRRRNKAQSIYMFECTCYVHNASMCYLCVHVRVCVCVCMCVCARARNMVF
jgi:hypothetical protein